MSIQQQTNLYHRQYLAEMLNSTNVASYDEAKRYFQNWKKPIIDGLSSEQRKRKNQELNNIFTSLYERYSRHQYEIGRFSLSRIRFIGTASKVRYFRRRRAELEKAKLEVSPEITEFLRNHPEPSRQVTPVVPVDEEETENEVEENVNPLIDEIRADLRRALEKIDILAQSRQS